MQPSRLGFLVPVIALLLSVSVLGACNDSTASAGSLDAEAAQSIVEGIVGQLEDNKAVGPVQGVGDLISQIAGLQDPLVSDQSSLALIPGALLGATCAWDPVAVNYFDDTARRGEGPADAVRFLLYTPDAVTMLPRVPLDEIGSFDVWDFSSGSQLDVHHAGAIGGATVLTFDVTGTLNASDYSLTTAGTLTTGGVTGNVTYLSELTTTGGTNLELSMTAGQYQVSYAISRSGEFFTGPGSDRVTLSDTQAGVTIEYIIDWDASEMVVPGAVIKINNVKVADVTGSGGFIEIALVEGTGLPSFADVALLEAYFSIFDLNGALFGVLNFGVENAGRTLPVF
ncbi:MAG: hypothetical protein JSW46_12785 [Gemmatimonadota bacterium]|nr:MAG: hypothetical protein JSW46_12785 [Gemmatimonadota bacterium]